MVLPAWPGECRQRIAHAAAGLGDSPVVVLRRERAQLDQANDRLALCANHYDGIKRDIEAGP